MCLKKGLGLSVSTEQFSNLNKMLIMIHFLLGQQHVIVSFNILVRQIMFLMKVFKKKQLLRSIMFRWSTKNGSLIEVEARLSS